MDKKPPCTWETIGKVVDALPGDEEVSARVDRLMQRDDEHTKLVRANEYLVEGCFDCPLRLVLTVPTGDEDASFRYSHCGADKPEIRSVTQYLEDGQPPDWCPLRKGPAEVRLKEDQ